MDTTPVNSSDHSGFVGQSPYDLFQSMDRQTSSSSPEDFNINSTNTPTSSGSKEMIEFCDANCEANCGTPCEWAQERAKSKAAGPLVGMDALNPSTTSDGRPRKHIRRACLECRKRHVRCDGVLPVCKKCSDNNRECNYVPSHRGGVRVPRKKLQQLQEENEENQKEPLQQQPQPEKLQTTSIGATPPAKVRPSMLASPCMIPIAPSSEPLHTSYVRGDSSISEPSLPNFANMLPFETGQESSHEIQEVINGVVALSPYNSSNHTSSHLSSPENTFQHSSSSYSYDSYIPTPTSDLSTSDMSTGEIINIYYSLFHHRHPILPPKTAIVGYLESTKGNELLKVMSFTAFILSSTGTPPIDEIFQRLQVARTAIEQAPEDLVKLQSAVVLSIVSHLCTDNNTSISLRTWCFDVCYRILSGYSLSSPASDVPFSKEPAIPVDLLSSWRTQQVDKRLFSDLFSRVIHEIFFLDIIFAVITRGKLSPFVNSNLIDSIPIKDVPGFAYRCRFRTMKVVRSISSSLASLGSGIQSSLEFTRLEALVTTFQGFMSDNLADMSQGFPHLMDDFGNVDDGVHQSIMMLNFSAILLHFPFSSLYQNKLPSYVQCTEDSAPIVSIKNAPLSRQRTVVSTRQCIQAANNIIKVVTDIGSSNISNRTPLYSCSVAMAMLVHMKAYHWLTRPGSDLKMDETLRIQEIGLYEAYVKLESNSLQMFGAKWILPNKLNTSLCNVMFNVLPELYESVIETEIRPKRKAEDPLVEKDCWMKNLQLDDSNMAKPSLDIFDQLFDLDTMHN